MFLGKLGAALGKFGKTVGNRVQNNVKSNIKQHFAVFRSPAKKPDAGGHGEVYGHDGASIGGSIFNTPVSNPRYYVGRFDKFLTPQHMAFGGRMQPGGRYRIGEENVQMNDDGTADVIPASTIEGLLRTIAHEHGNALPQPINAPTGGEPLPQPIDAPTGGVPLSDEISGTVRAPATRDEQITSDEAELRNLDENPLPKRGFWRRFLKGVEMSRGSVQTTGQPGADLGRILGSALGGGIGLGAMPKREARIRTDEEKAKIQDRIKRNVAYRDADIGSEYKKAQTKALGDKAILDAKKLDTTVKRNADLEYDRGAKRVISKIKLGYKKGTNPQLDAEAARFGIDIDQWDDNKRTFWQGQNYMTFDENGEAVPVTGADGTPVTDVTRAPVTLTIDGTPFTVSQTVGFQGLTQAGKTNTDIGNKDIEDENDRVLALGKVDADLKGIDQQLTDLTASNDNLRAQLANLRPADVYGDKEKAAQIQQQIDANDAKNVAARSKQAELKANRDKLSKPLQKRKTVSAPKVSPTKDPMGLFR